MKQSRLYIRVQSRDRVHKKETGSFKTTYDSVNVARGIETKSVRYKQYPSKVEGLQSAPADIAGWCSFVDSLDIDFSHHSELLPEQQDNEPAFSQYSKLVGKLVDAIKDYIAVSAENQREEISSDSARNYFYLLPVLSRRKHEVSIDADTGFVTVALLSSDKSLMSALLTGKGDIHYSYINRGVRLVKISGVAKIKDKRDFGQFERVLRMI